MKIGESISEPLLRFFVVYLPRMCNFYIRLTLIKKQSGGILFYPCLSFHHTLTHFFVTKFSAPVNLRLLIFYTKPHMGILNCCMRFWILIASTFCLPKKLILFWQTESRRYKFSLYSGAFSRL